MSLLPVFRRFSVADYPTAPNWLSEMFSPLNVFCETTVDSLTKNLTIGENVQGQKYTTSFTTPTDYATGGFPAIALNYTGGGQPTCCIVGQITRDDGALILTPVTVTSWAVNLNTSPFQIRINYVAGLSANTKYNMAVVTL